MLTTIILALHGSARRGGTVHPRGTTPRAFGRGPGRRPFFRAPLSNFVTFCRRSLPAAALAMALLLPTVHAITPDTVTVPAGAETITYGTSGQGRSLKAYRFGDGKNTLVLTFAIHGFEDAWDGDGEALVYTADRVMQDLARNATLLLDYDWSVYVLPCLNPDGLLSGHTNNGFGRCTSAGIDMNRSFPYRWTSYTSSRYRNGSAPLACPESKALAGFLQSIGGTGKKVLVDTHGWTSQLLTSGGKGTLYNCFHAQFPTNSHQSLTHAAGYLTSYAAYSLGYDACLMEFPWGPDTMAEFLQTGYADRFCTAVRTVLRSYGPSNHHSDHCAAAQYTDVNELMWYHEAVDYVVSHDLMSGVSATAFGPNQPATRAMVTVLLWRMAGSPDPLIESELTLPQEAGSDTLLLAGPPGADAAATCAAAEPSTSPLATGYFDVAEDSWYAPAILWANHNQLLPESDSSYFHPDSPISRQDLITMLYRYSHPSGDGESDQGTLACADAGQVEPYAVAAMA